MSQKKPIIIIKKDKGFTFFHEAEDEDENREQKVT